MVNLHDMQRPLRAALMAGSKVLTCVKMKMKISFVRGIVFSHVRDHPIDVRTEDDLTPGNRMREREGERERERESLCLRERARARVIVLLRVFVIQI
jgi:hypothetical protein